MGLTAEGTERVRAALRRKRGEVAKKLEEILAGQNIQLNDIKLPQFEDAAEPPSETLRRFMRHLADISARLGTPEFGRCGKCGAELSEAALVETPWADRCRACA
jgi:RNA polymerase-binding transcription factor DksA